MVERRELINVFRQIGIMMQAGVDFLRITHVLRAQTENPRLATLYNDLDHDLTMGMSLADAMARQPDIFSPFAVSLVRQTEMRSDMAEMSQDLAAAFLRVADYLQQEEAQPRARGNYNAAQMLAAPPASSQTSSDKAGGAGLAPSFNRASIGSPRLEEGASPALTKFLVVELEHRSATLRLIAWRALLFLSLLCVALAALEISVALGWLEARWLGAALWAVSALFMGSATLWLWPRGTARHGAATPVIHATPPQPASSDEISAESHSATPSAPPFASAVTRDDEIDESGQLGGAVSEPEAEPGNEPGLSVARGNWADLKQNDRPSALPIWAREEEAAGLPPLPIGPGQIFATPPDSNARPTSQPDRASHLANLPEEADYD